MKIKSLQRYKVVLWISDIDAIIKNAHANRFILGDVFRKNKTIFVQ